MAAARHQGFEHFVAGDGARLRRVLVARYGVEVGWDACAEALAYGWTHWERVGAMDNPAGYLCRVAVSATRRHRRWQRSIELPRETADAPDASVAASAHDAVGDRLDDDLGAALARLRPRQRTCDVPAPDDVSWHQLFSLAWTVDAGDDEPPPAFDWTRFPLPETGYRFSLVRIPCAVPTPPPDPASWG